MRSGETPKPRRSEHLSMSFSLRVLISFLFLATVARAQSPGEFEHEFTYKPDGSPSKVAVAGDFNNWSADASPMTKGDDGIWHAKLKLPEGVQHYKFVVDGNQW